MEPVLLLFKSVHALIRQGFKKAESLILFLPMKFCFSALQKRVNSFV